MSHIGVIAPPFYSHFKALQSLAVALVKRGHRLTFIHQTDAQRWLGDPRIDFEAVGMKSHPIGSLANTLRRAANPGGPLGLRRVIIDLSKTTDMLCQELPAVITRLNIDALICDQMEAAGGLIAEAMHLAWISVACALPVNREAMVPLPVMPFSFEPSKRAEKIVAGSTAVYDWMMKPHAQIIEHHARAFGLTSRRSLHECLSPFAQISQTVAAFDFPRAHLPTTFHHVGPLRDQELTETALNISIADHRPFIFASLGTMQGQRFNLFKRIAQASKRLNAQLLIAHCGGLNERQTYALKLAGATWVTDFVPQRLVLARADAVVSHAGLNTVIDAIAARTPILALPIAFDQPGVAARVTYAGVGLRASARFATTKTLADSLQRLIFDAAYTNKLETLSAAFDTAGGTQQAADIVEAVINKHKQPVGLALTTS